MKKRNILIILTSVFCVVVIGAGIFTWNNYKKEELIKDKELIKDRYIEAISLKEEGKYKEALEIFEDLDGYKKSDEFIEEINKVTQIPLAQIKYQDEYLILNAEGEVIKESADKEAGIPVLVGIGTEDLEDEKIREKVLLCVNGLKEADILCDVTVMSFEDMTNITFNYQSRIDVICGTHKDFEKKINLFKEGVSPNMMSPSARGTIDLSTTGRVIYTP